MQHIKIYELGLVANSRQTLLKLLFPVGRDKVAFYYQYEIGQITRT